MIQLTEREILDFYSRYLKIHSTSGDQAMAFCPFHPNHNTPALSLNLVTGQYNCKSPACNRSGNIIAFAKDQNISLEEIPGYHPGNNGNSNIEKTWDYRDSDGTLLYQEVRFTGKQTRFRRPVPGGSGTGSQDWIWNLKGSKRVLFNLPALLSTPGDKVYFVEGPKDAETLITMGLKATTNAMGARSWRSEYSDTLKPFHVVICTDNDEDGKHLAQTAAQDLLGKAQSVKILELPGLGYKEDITDWFAKGHTLEELHALEAKTPCLDTPKSKFDYIEPIGALLDRQFPDDKWLVENIWPHQARGWIAGNPGSNKTWFAMELGFAIATGLPFLDHFAVKEPGKVLYIQQELMEKHHKERWNLMLPPKSLDNEILERFKTNFYHITNKQITLPEDTDALIAATRNHGFKAVFVDSFSEAHYSNENSAQEMRLILMALTKIRNELGTSIIAIHHLGKSNKDTSQRSVFERMRGSSALWGWRNMVIAMTTENNDEYKSRVQFQSQVSESPEEFVFTRDLIAQGFLFNRIAFEQTDTFSEACDRIIEVLEESTEVMSFNKINTKAKGRRDNNRKAIRSLEYNGQVEKVKGGYRLTNLGGSGTSGNHLELLKKSGTI